MNKFGVLLVILLLSISLSAQKKNIKTEKLSDGQIEAVITEKMKIGFKITEPLKSVYHYQDQSGEFYLLLCEEKSANNQSIRALFLKKEKNELKKLNELSDTTIFNKKLEYQEEWIGFWDKYFEFQDIDNDGLIDPILVYAVQGINGIEGGRIKIILFYKNKKISICHQNGILDYHRNTKVDSAFYALKLVFQNHIKEKMKRITKEGNAIFPHGWEEAMQQKKMYFDEN